MAKRENNQEEHGHGLLAAAAKAIGGLAGKVAASVGAGEGTGGTSRAPAKKRGKLARKNKTRLPRREKKARKKAANLHAA
jgi:hypothetical protein